MKKRIMACLAVTLVSVPSLGWSENTSKAKTILLAGMEVPAIPVEYLDKKPESLTPTVKYLNTKDDVAKHKPVKHEKRLHASAVKTRTTIPQVKEKGEDAIKFSAKLTTKISPGVNQIIKISKGHLNRIITPFELAVVETVSSATIESRGESIYVTSSDDYPITMFVHEKGADDPSVSLTLIPSPIPPRQVRIIFDAETGVYPVAGAKRWESTHPYIENIKDGMSSLAKGQIPHGYGFRKFKASRDPYPECANKSQGIEVKPAQTIEGHSIVYVVASVQNDSSGVIELDEHLCYEDGVLAAAFWPNVRLHPGQKTELYVAYKRPERASARQRKSVIR